MSEKTLSQAVPLSFTMTIPATISASFDTPLVLDRSLLRRIFNALGGVELDSLKLVYHGPRKPVCVTSEKSPHIEAYIMPILPDSIPKECFETRV